MLWVLISYASLTKAIPHFLSGNHTIGEIYVVSQGLSHATLSSIFCLFSDTCKHKRNSSLLLGVWIVLLLLYFLHIMDAKYLKRHPQRHGILPWLFSCVVALALSFSNEPQDNPVLWTLDQLQSKSYNLLLVMYWVVMLVLFFTVLVVFQNQILHKRRNTIVRKYFHLLTVLLFVPGIYIDPQFHSFAISAVLSLFVISEYVRYYRLPPFGDKMHSLMSIFVDAKDTGSAILTHFYLLLGCALPLIVGAPTENLVFLLSGTLLLGVGDSMASVIGSAYGSVFWQDGSKKSVQGTIAAFVSMVAVSTALVVWVPPKDTSLFMVTLCIFLATLFEANTSLIDNLILPIYYASLLLGLKAL
uniref:dolichol kinase n=1 Tax=Arcella intermedia TaxID=1963864 RepID=A0A6B2L845_9EUKA